MSKQEIFKRILSGYYRSVNNLDKELWATMSEKFYWSLTLNDKDENVAFKSISGDFYITNIYENSLGWHNDIRSCLKILDRI